MVIVIRTGLNKLDRYGERTIGVSAPTVAALLLVDAAVWVTIGVFVGRALS